MNMTDGLQEDDDGINFHANAAEVVIKLICSL